MTQLDKTPQWAREDHRRQKKGIIIAKKGTVPSTLVQTAVTPAFSWHFHGNCSFPLKFWPAAQASMSNEAVTPYLNLIFDESYI